MKILVDRNASLYSVFINEHTKYYSDLTPAQNARCCVQTLGTQDIGTRSGPCPCPNSGVGT